MIVYSLKNYYNEQMELLANLEKEDSAAKVTELSKGWDLHKKAVSQLEKSVEESEKIVQSGVKALWISANNPDITRVKTNEVSFSSNFSYSRTFDNAIMGLDTFF